MFESPPKQVLRYLEKTISEKTTLIDALNIVLSNFDRTYPQYKRSEDGDMLLFQYGCYDWGKGENFEFDIVRQFYRNERILQIHVTYYYKPNEELRNVEARNGWLNSDTTPEKWKKEILDSAGLKAIKNLTPDRIAVRMEDAE